MQSANIILLCQVQFMTCMFIQICFHSNICFIQICFKCHSKVNRIPEKLCYHFLSSCTEDKPDTGQCKFGSKMSCPAHSVCATHLEHHLTHPCLVVCEGVLHLKNDHECSQSVSMYSLIAFLFQNVCSFSEGWGVHWCNNSFYKQLYYF